MSHEPSPGSRFALATLSLKGEEIKPLSRNLREREGPGAKRREGEGDSSPRCGLIGLGGFLALGHGLATSSGGSARFFHRSIEISLAAKSE